MIIEQCSLNLPSYITMDMVLLILCFHALGSLVNAEDQSHQFEYEYRVLEKQVELQNNDKDLLDQIGQMNQRIRQLTHNYDVLAGSVDALRESIGGGSTYVRLGRTTCPGNGTELVYEGFAAGSFYEHYGGAADYLCLPSDPQWGVYDDSKHGQGFVFGGEYQFPGTDYFVHDGSMMNQDVPCAVCRSPRPTERMFPAKKDCPDGWSLEYTGYLCSGYYGHKAASKNVCLDGEPESVGGGSTDKNGKLFYLVEGRCGSLPCPPYVDGRELTCSVCTK